MSKMDHDQPYAGWICAKGTPQDPTFFITVRQDFYYTIVYPLVTLRAMKDVGLRIRVQRDLRDAFVAVCREQDKPAAQVLREFMRAYVESHPIEEAASSKQQTRKPD
ncbi:hypothetical protein [Microbaculum marinisediminis]|uniref:CopG family transcriptional regulator n=1 Tax=Microbaculum marinisediminis TaxID=2931392 RepID=A0AAW5QUV7_9HYPH|nr:hypothetical protein [Microbaculum sp. A6E488]MCT8970795.1 hypothetical protein [Microbaculum sp. A6E488]